MTLDRDRLDAVERFADALEQGTGGLVKHVRSDGDWIVVEVDLPTGRVNEAQSIASAHRFRLKYAGPRSSDGSDRRYVFEAKRASLDLHPGFDWDLPGGVR